MEKGDPQKLGLQVALPGQGGDELLEPQSAEGGVVEGRRVSTSVQVLGRSGGRSPGHKGPEVLAERGPVEPWGVVPKGLEVEGGQGGRGGGPPESKGGEDLRGGWNHRDGDAGVVVGGGEGEPVVDGVLAYCRDRPEVGGAGGKALRRKAHGGESHGPGRVVGLPPGDPGFTSRGLGIDSGRSLWGRASLMGRVGRPGTLCVHTQYPVCAPPIPGVCTPNTVQILHFCQKNNNYWPWVVTRAQKKIRKK